ncbi:MAG: V4R domain-containing protein [Coprobacillus sp.]
MFELFKEEEERFSWDDIGDIKEGRQNLGEQMPVAVFRLFQYSIKQVLADKYGKDETIRIFRESGELAGREFALNNLQLSLEWNEFTAHLQQVLETMKIGILRVEKFDFETGHAVLTIGEDIDCSGLPVTGETVCNYDEGFLAGILKEYTKQEYVVTEVDCWATGSRVCRFEAHIDHKE